MYEKFSNNTLFTQRDLISNNIIDMYEDNNETLFIGTGNGLGYGLINNENIYEFNMFQNDNLPAGGTPALVVNDNLIKVVSGIQLIETSIGNLPEGTGVSYSLDGGDTWYYMPQPKDDLYQDIDQWGCQWSEDNQLYSKDY